MVTEHQVRERAYFIWEGEGRSAGRAEAHWLQAEAELHARVAPLVVEAVETSAKPAPSPAKVLKPAAKKIAKAAKDAEPKAVKAKRTSRARVEQIALH